MHHKRLQPESKIIISKNHDIARKPRELTFNLSKTSKDIRDFLLKTLQYATESKEHPGCLVLDGHYIKDIIEIIGRRPYIMKANLTGAFLKGDFETANKIWQEVPDDMKPELAKKLGFWGGTIASANKK